MDEAGRGDGMDQLVQALSALPAEPPCHAVG